MERKIRKAAVLGSGVMGAGIAAHLANVGIPTLLLDIVPRELTEDESKKGLTLADSVVKNRIAQTGKDRLLKEKPAPLYDKKNIDLITVGNFDDHLPLLSDVDWIIEVVVENLEVKKLVFAQIEAHRKPGTIVTSNTSGVSINEMAEGRSEDFRKHFLGTHFFNPPRYLKLLEIIPSRDTDPAVVSFMSDFGEHVLGKGTVLCKDTPNFIANRIGTYGLQVSIHVMQRIGLGVDEVDALTGPVIGRPKSATFRTLDVVGLDTYVHVAGNVRNKSADEQEKAIFEVPAFVLQMVEKRMIGQKAGQGFFKQVKSAQGKEILALDTQTLEYRPSVKAKFASLDAAKTAKTLPEKLKALAYGKDKGSEFVWSVLKKVLLYSADKVHEIADDLVAVDQAMKWGFGWELGPFETWDAIGVEKSVARMREEGETIPALVEELLASGKTSFYEKKEGCTAVFSVGGVYKNVEEKKERINLAALKEQGKLIRKNAGAALIDLGDGVACLEFTSPHNALGMDLLQMAHVAAEEVQKNFVGLVIGNQGKNFCVGMNLAMALMEAQDENWLELDLLVTNFHKAAKALRYLHRPVVAAPFGMTLGGGVEVLYLADRVQASVETYLGLVEVGVGLLPGGGGTKEMLFRAMENLPDTGSVPVDSFPLVAKAFETIAMAKVSTSGQEAIDLGYLRQTDRISINPDHLLYDAKQLVLSMDKEGYTPPAPRKIKVIGETGFANLSQNVYAMKKSGYISDHDELIANKIAYVMSGGDLPAGTEVTEEYILGLEKQAFLELLKTPKTQQRMQHMLTKNKPLRN
ncbi:enoyl-CoA hydratase [Brevibacillus reuszeri]|uniref:3-hydroxyacyl-CoA dehydrogenase n=1 Tax=Brevibacillus reuszeri TaxID=54915 RepID=A0A0K9YLX5_9BACL|nr:3-hydroxyacyl-CoA dehydrogenase/enoyl-CoA hydratase family protein [Brevibacillus reuszeri]KNB69738.1 3-hydroxyacyl-CoA dehydrogenase [Brevibacillus reuszeri]MED1858080.1 3-hydroxyacyl-CoA dehydrogenase NAD-binding domain-containing protein [Brevibacillus reuszeri]GED68928.1 enoyl-CoA hydratase [Brevibacillus reuszeri]